jgi:hypothetical protein
MKRTACMLSAAVCLAWTLSAHAQEATMTPPKVLVIQREMVKPGKNAAHAKTESAFVRAFAKAKWPTHYIGATGLSGENRAVFFVGYDSLAAWEADSKAQEKNPALSAELDAANDKDGDYLTEFRQGIFKYMDDLSYQPAPQMTVAGTRYFRVFTVHVKPGHNDHFEAVRKLVKAAHEKAGLNEHYAVFSMIAGGPGGTYLLFIPMKSLAEVDNFDTLHGKAYKAALGEDGQKAIDDFNMNGVESTESNILALNPGMSYPAQAWIDADKFWSPAKPAAKMAEKKADKKPE